MDVAVNCYENTWTMSRRKRSAPVTQSITSFFSKTIRLNEGKTISVRITHVDSFVQGWHYPSNLTCTVTDTASQHANESVDTASQCTVPITSTDCHTSSSDEMAGDSLEDPATTCTASGISTNGGITDGSLGNPNSTWFWLMCVIKAI